MTKMTDRVRGDMTATWDKKAQQREVQPGYMTANGSWLRLQRISLSIAPLCAYITLM